MSSADQPHDARMTLSDLRDHLVRHDKPIAYFFGAVTSCAVTVPSPDPPGKREPLIPAVHVLTDLCRDDVRKMGHMGPNI